MQQFGIDSRTALPTSVSASLAWVYGIGASARPLLLALRRRWRLAPPGSLRLLTSEGRSQARGAAAYQRFELGWFVPSWGQIIATPIEVYLSRLHFLQVSATTPRVDPRPGSEPGVRAVNRAAGTSAGPGSPLGLRLPFAPGNILSSHRHLRSAGVGSAQGMVMALEMAGLRPPSPAAAPGFATLTSRRQTRFATRAIMVQAADNAADMGFSRMLHLRPPIRSLTPARTPEPDAPLPLRYAPGTAPSPSDPGLTLGPKPTEWAPLRLAAGLPQSGVDVAAFPQVAARATAISRLPAPNEASTLVEALYEQGLQEGAIPAMSLHLLPPAAGVTPEASAQILAATTAQAAVRAAPPHLQAALAPSTSLSRSELAHIAERVAQVLRDRQRFERERQGRR